MNTRPIGIFDSGVGGLTVVKEIFRTLPFEEIVYLGDTARLPYGTKSPETIRHFSLENVEFLMRFKVKMIIVACNTASSTSLDILRDKYKIPIIGVIKPGVVKATTITRNNRIGVIGTYATIKSRAYEKEIIALSKDILVFSQACPMFVPLVEEGWVNGDITLRIAKKYLSKLISKHIDTLILGCTHYPLLRPVISKIIGQDVKIVDSASSVAEEAHNILTALGALRKSSKTPNHRFFATDAVENFVKIGERFLGSKIKRVERADYV